MVDGLNVVGVTKNKDEKASSQQDVPSQKSRDYEILYRYVLSFSYLHIAALYGLYLCFTSAKWGTILLAIILCIAGLIGITAGAHRLWSHKTYKVNRALEILLIIMNSVAFQNSAVQWIRDHRLHHKYSDTDADPHNAKRGFFFSHIGWLMVKKHPDVLSKGKSIDMSDIYSNPVLMFQKKYALPIFGILCFGLPTLIPMYFWEESLNNAWHLTILRYTLCLNITFLVNSAAHFYGQKPYDNNILPRQNILVSILAVGEGFHNYHHVFPWDYRTAELGNNVLNLTTKFIDFFAWLGLASEMKTVSTKAVDLRAKRTGDGTNLWGWGDEHMTQEEIKAVDIIFPDTEVNEKCKHLVNSIKY
ncbi:acyl-CoA Delta(11) desaturase-like [Cydia amplana]|uniref:acyl-CoA Delta(11) desaturase-like n=1 Tax=Cydia amplana TaxID=1869771 RepID=UPI002FE5CB58